MARVYDDPQPGVAGVLVDRLWPRGVSKKSAPFDEWSKEVAPSTELRTWYGHQPERFAEFARRYRAELKRNPAKGAFGALRDRARSEKVVLVTATKDLDHSGAAVLKDALLER
jgi:uncharacterized protein YeaO (DUF488 family)